MKVLVELDKDLWIPLCDECGLIALSGMVPKLDCDECTKLMILDAFNSAREKRKKKLKFDV